MALASHLARREGRYHLQIRCTRSLLKLLEKPLLRISLRSAEYRQARRRLAECLTWVYDMNDSDDLAALFAKNVLQIRTYLADQHPISEDRLFARRTYEEMLKNLNRRAQMRGLEMDVFERDYRPLFEAFVAQNIELENLHRERDRMIAYERGRADVSSGIAMGIIPVPRSAQSGLSNPDVHLHPGLHTVAPVPASSPSVSTQEPASAASPGLPETLLSVALEAYLAKHLEKRGHDSERGETGLIVQFFLDQIGDLPVGQITSQHWRTFERLLPDIPNRTGIPKSHQRTLSTRYDYAKKHGWNGLHRLTEARIRKSYHSSIGKFFKWLAKEGYYLGLEPQLSYISQENLASLPRDSFDEREVIKIFEQPLFTGCLSRTRIWQPGTYFIQNELYWAYLLALFTGMRPSEIGQLKVSDFETSKGATLINLQLFDPTKGRVALKDLKQLKTANAARKIPLHPLLIDLGLMKRVNDLKSIDCDVLFPEWQPYQKPSGEVRWGQPVSKSWQYLKKQLGLTRENISLYSARHWMADQLDDLSISHRTRHRVMGHADQNVDVNYGSKSRYSTRDLDELTGLGAGILEELSEILMSAKNKVSTGELTKLKPWLQHTQWSDYHRHKLLDPALIKS